MNTDELWVSLVTAIVLAVLFAGSCAFNQYQCEQLRHETGNATKYRLTTGCYVKVNGRWIPEERWRGTDTP